MKNKPLNPQLKSRRMLKPGKRKHFTIYLSANCGTSRLKSRKIFRTRKKKNKPWTLRLKSRKILDPAYRKTNLALPV